MSFYLHFKSGHDVPELKMLTAIAHTETAKPLLNMPWEVPTKLLFREYYDYD